MDVMVLERRHPALGELLRLWRAQGGLSAELGPRALRLHAPTTAQFDLVDDGRLVPSRVGEGLIILGVTERQGAVQPRPVLRQWEIEAEARVALETRSPVLLEDGPLTHRVARLHLPLFAKIQGNVVGVLCGAVLVSK